VLRHLEAEQMAEGAAGKEARAAAMATAKGVAAIEAYFAKSDGELRMSRADIRSGVNVWTKVFDAGWSELKRSGRLVSGQAGAWCLRPAQ
jgi:hypothetical protein